MKNRYRPSEASLRTPVSGPAGSRWPRRVHLAAILVTGFSLSIAPPETADMRFAVTVHALMVLSYPLGVIGSLCASALILSGIATLEEAYFAATPVFAIAGYLQWNVLIPRVFGLSKRHAQPPDETHGHA